MSGRGEDLDLYVQTLHERAMDCSDPFDGEVLLNVCLHRILEEFRVLLENLSLSSFSRLMEVARRTNGSVRRTLRSSSTSCPSFMIRLPPRKRPIVALEKKRPSFKHERQPFPVQLPLPFDVKKATTLLE